MRSLAVAATALLLTGLAMGPAGAETVDKPLTPTPEEAYRQAIVAYGYGMEPAFRIAPGYQQWGAVAGDPATEGFFVRR